MRPLLAVLALLPVSLAVAAPTCLGPTPYVKKADSPFDLSNVGTTFFFDDFEGPTRVAGVTASAGSVVGFPMSIIDSVDEDDGAIDGSGLMGHSWFSGDGAGGVTWTFDAPTLGGLPTAAGIVWTDGAGTVSFQAIGADGVTVLCDSGPVSDPGVFPDASFDGETAEDRFFGVYDAGGIASIALSNSSGGIEMDHIQFGMVGLATTTTTSTTPPTSSTTSTTSTPASSTTTTTVPTCGAVPPAPTFASIDCRLDALGARLAVETGLGAFTPKLVHGVQTAKARSVDAEGLCRDANLKRTRKRLQQSAKALAQFAHRLSSLAARRKLDATLRQDYVTAASSIRDSVKALRGAVRCPQDAGT